MAKRHTNTEAPANGAGTAPAELQPNVAEKTRKPRAKRPYVLEEYVTLKSLDETEKVAAWRRVEYSDFPDFPDFPNTAAAHKWAESHDLPKADYRVVRVMSEFTIETETKVTTKIVVK